MEEMAALAVYLSDSTAEHRAVPLLLRQFPFPRTYRADAGSFRSWGDVVDSTEVC